MSGKLCTACYRQTFHLTRTGRQCSQCGHSEEDPALAYLGNGIPGSRFSVDSLKAIGSRASPAKTQSVSSAQAELNHLVQQANRRLKKG